MLPNYKVFLLVTTLISFVNRVYLIHLVIIFRSSASLVRKQNATRPLLYARTLSPWVSQAHFLLVVKATFFHHQAVNLVPVYAGLYVHNLN